MSDPNNSIIVLQQAVDNYGALLHGLIVSPDPQSAGESKLRYGVKFRWTNTLGGNKTQYVKTVLLSCSNADDKKLTLLGMSNVDYNKLVML